MKTNYLTQRVTVPTTFVTKGRQRVKQFNNSVYLKNGDEFEIELFNPTNQKILAKINLNGESLGSGIILRPGERVFLERYFDVARKFRFETYQVESNNPNVEQAIRLNGLVEVEFFEECKYNPNPVSYTGSGFVWTDMDKTIGPGIYYYANTGGIPDGEVNFVNDTYNANSGSAFSCSCSFDPPEMELKETGRIEKGSSSAQGFIYDGTSFNFWCTWKDSWKILPESERPLESHDLKTFCTRCGAKQKKHTHKFCPICGTKYE